MIEVAKVLQVGQRVEFVMLEVAGGLVLGIIAIFFLVWTMRFIVPILILIFGAVAVAGYFSLLSKF